VDLKELKRVRSEQVFPGINPAIVVQLFTLKQELGTRLILLFDQAVNALSGKKQLWRLEKGFNKARCFITLERGVIQQPPI